VEDATGKLGKANVTIGRKDISSGGATSNVGGNDYFNMFEDSPPKTLDVLANDGLSPGAEIIEVSTPEGIGGTVAIATDGKTLVYQPPAGKIGSDHFAYTYRDADGETGTLQVVVSVDKPYQARSYSDFVYHIGTVRTC
jgi:large repetitive protein